MADQDQEMGNGEGQQEDYMNGEAGNGESTDASSGKDDDRKLFVGGLSWETSDKELREHFSKYGEIENINVKVDPNTGRSRGFAFIVFKDVSVIDKVIAAGDHVINGKKIDPKKAKAKLGKIFVGGLSTDLTDDDIKNYFAQYGTIVDTEMPFDKTKNQRKGFCFITFESEQVVTELLKNAKQSINGKEVDVKRATPKPDGFGGRGRGRGGRGARGGRGGKMSGYGAGGYASSYPSYGYGAGYDYYGAAYGGGYGTGYDSYGYGGYGGYGDYGYGYDSGYAVGAGGGGGRGRGKGGYGGGKTRGGGRGSRHAPY